MKKKCLKSLIVQSPSKLEKVFRLHHGKIYRHVSHIQQTTIEVGGEKKKYANE